MFGGMLSRKLSAVIVAAGATLLLTAPSASALIKVSATGADRGDGVWVGEATCPGDRRVVSGGFSMSDASDAVVNRAKGKHTWIVKAQDTGGPVDVFAYCSANLRPSTASDRSGFSQSTSLGRAKAHCDRGETAVSGGWQYNDLSDNQTVFRSYGRGGRTWSVQAFTGDSTRITAYAYCLHSNVEGRSKASGPIGDEVSDSTTARCHSGEEALGGGFKTKPKSDYSNDTGPDFFYSASARAGSRGWKASAHNYSAISGRMTVTAICR
jgi:hypothetical protein